MRERRTEPYLYTSWGGGQNYTGGGLGSTALRYPSKPNPTAKLIMQYDISERYH